MQCSDNKIYTCIVNFSENLAPNSECIVTRIEYRSDSDYGSSNKDIVKLAGGIQVYKSTYDDIISVYGEPGYQTGVFEDDNIYVLYYTTSDYYQKKFDFVIDATNNVVCQVEMECEKDPDNEGDEFY